MGREVAIETNSLQKEYGGVTALDGLDVTVERGEVFGFLGPNGAGKSTTIDILLDFVRPTAGEVSVLGHDPQANPRAVREHVGVLLEATGLYGRDTARDHLRFAIAMKRADDDPHTLLERVGIVDAADQPVGGFSKGMRKRLGLAIALVDSPDLLVLDEPLGGLDPSGARLLREIVREESERGAAVFFSSHIMDQVEAICDRIGIMHDGRLVVVDTVEALLASSTAPTTIMVSLQRVPEGIVNDVESLDGVVDASIDNGRLAVECTEPAVTADIVTRLDATGVSVDNVATDMPSLEEVFMSITADSSPEGERRGEPDQQPPQS